MRPLREPGEWRYFGLISRWIFHKFNYVLSIYHISKPLRPAVNSSVDQAMGVDDFYIDVAQELLLI